MAQIPSDIQREILLRLPGESLVRFRAVCREWCNIIDDKSFILSHTIKSQLSSTTLLIRTSNTGLYSISVDSLINCADNGRENLEATSFRAFRDRTFSLTPRCNGLILLSWRNSKLNRVILNTFTRKFHELPQFTVAAGYCIAGLGYDSSSNDYKVVAVGRDRRQRYEYDDPYSSFVYSMKSDSWRKIADVVGPGDIRLYDCDGVFIDGFLHWKSNYSVTRFNLATDLFDRVPLPKTDREPRVWDLGMLDGCLVVSLYYKEREYLEVWVMKGGGWMKLFSIANIICFMMPIAYFMKMKGLVLLTVYHKFLYLFDIEKNSLKMVRIDGLLNEITYVMCFSGSLAPLDDRGGAGTPNSRVKLSVRTIDTPLGFRQFFRQWY